MINLRSIPQNCTLINNQHANVQGTLICYKVSIKVAVLSKLTLLTSTQHASATVMSDKMLVQKQVTVKGQSAWNAHAQNMLLTRVILVFSQGRCVDERLPACEALKS